MRIVLDSNVLMSGIFFGGTPGQIVDAWKEGRIAFALSPSILDEYRRIGEELEAKYGDFGLSSILTVIELDPARFIPALVEAQHLLTNDHTTHALLKNPYEVDLVRDRTRWLIQKMTIHNTWLLGTPTAIFEP